LLNGLLEQQCVFLHSHIIKVLDRRWSNLPSGLSTKTQNFKHYMITSTIPFNLTYNLDGHVVCEKIAYMTFLNDANYQKVLDFKFQPLTFNFEIIFTA